MKITTCLYMAFCLWGMCYFANMISILSITDVAAFMAIGVSTIEHVDRVYHNWFK